MRSFRFSNLLAALLLLLVFVLAPTAMALDEEDDMDETEHCSEATVEGIAPRPYLNGLPLVEEELEVVGDAVKVMVQIPPFCHIVTPASLPFRWDVTGPSGPVTLTDDGTLRPHFRPMAAGQDQVQLTYCPHTCHRVAVGASTTTVDIPPQTARFDFTVVDEIALPPDTEPQLPSWAQEEDPDVLVDANNDERRRKCDFPGFNADWFTPQLVPVKPWIDQNSYRLLEGRVKSVQIAGHDNELNHSSHDAIANVIPDRHYANLKVSLNECTEVESMEVEWETDSFPGRMRPLPMDRISAFGFHTYDCHHNDDTFGILTEIHPPVLTAVHRKRPIRIPNGWQELGDNIYVPGIITDIWANKRAGEMTNNCSTTGLHQEAVPNPYAQYPTPDYVAGPCIRSPHPLDRQFTFHIYLPPNPQKRMAESGVMVPPAPLYWNIESGGEHLTVTPEPPDDVSYLIVTVDLTGYTGEQYAARIVAGWVQPSPDNWGLERWKVGISALDIHNDHDSFPYDDGDWIFWTAINNRDQEWTRLLDGEAVTGLHTFTPSFETESGQANRSLGPHVELFHPRYVDFPGSPLEDFNRSFFLHSSGYDAEVADDPAGLVNLIDNLATRSIPIGTRANLSHGSSTGDYSLIFYVEPLGLLLPTLSAAGKTLASAYSLHPHEARCARVPTAACVLFPERLDTAKPWHPLLARLQPKHGELEWRDFSSYRNQEPEELGFTGISAAQLHTWLTRMQYVDPKRVEQFGSELRQKFDRVHGTRMESEFAKAIPLLKANFPADVWQRHFADIDSTSVAPSKLWVWVTVGAFIAFVALIAALAFFLRRNMASHDT